MKETHGICDLTKIAPDRAWWKTMRITLDQVEKICRRRRFVWYWLRCCGRKNKIVIVIILEEIQQGADIWMSMHDCALYPERV